MAAIAPAPQTTAAPVEKLVFRQPDLLARLGISKTTLWRMIAAGAFPKPFKLGKLNGWKVSDVNEWLKGA